MGLTVKHIGLERKKVGSWGREGEMVRWAFLRAPKDTTGLPSHSILALYFLSSFALGVDPGLEL